MREHKIINNNSMLVKLGENIQVAGGFILRYGLVLILLWIGIMKFTTFEAEAIEPIIASSPLMRWLYGFLSIRGASVLLGIIEISIAIMIAARPIFPKISGVGSLFAVCMFITTLTFLFTLPGWEQSLGGFPALSSTGGFIVKDLLLLGSAVWTLGDSLQSCRMERTYNFET